MTDKEILAKVYEKLKSRYHSPEQKMFGAVALIEQEWQGRDEQELIDQHNRNREVKDHVSTTDQIQDARLSLIGLDDYSSDPCTTDVKEIERHRGLEIGPDGTVTDIK